MVVDYFFSRTVPGVSKASPPHANYFFPEACFVFYTLCFLFCFSQWMDLLQSAVAIRSGNWNPDISLVRGKINLESDVTRGSPQASFQGTPHHSNNIHACVLWMCMVGSQLQQLYVGGCAIVWNKFIRGILEMVRWFVTCAMRAYAAWCRRRCMCG